MLEGEAVNQHQAVSGVLPALPRVAVYHGGDGCPVVDIDTSARGVVGRDEHGDPYVRVSVDGAMVVERGPDAPLPGSRDAIGISGPGPNDRCEATHPPGVLRDALQLALVTGLEAVLDPEAFPDLVARGLLRIEYGPQAHKVGVLTRAGRDLLRGAVAILSMPRERFEF